MRLPDRHWPVVLCSMLAVAGCAGPKGVKPPRPELAVAPTYVARDDEQVRRLHGYQTQLALAGSELQAGQLDSSERRARAALKLMPARADAMLVLAAVAERRGRQAEAGQWLQRAAEGSPERGDVLNNYGAWLCQNGQAVQSLSWFDRALAAPGYATAAAALSNAGTCALAAGQGERAERDLRKALEQDPGNVQALESMARRAFDENSFFEARAFVQRRLSAAPATVSMLQLASQIEARLGDKRASDQYLQRLKQDFPQDAGTTTRVEG